MTPLFKRSDKTTIAELEDYYANQKRSRTGTAWMMALLSLLITVAVILALFFGGRWLYRTLTDDSEFAPVATQDSDANDTRLPSVDGELPGSNDDRTAGDDEDEADDDTEGVVSDEAVSTTRDVDSSIDDEEGAATGAELPDTGAGELIILLPLATGIVGYTISRQRQLSR